MEKARPSLF
jgi:hypothetical protein